MDKVFEGTVYSAGDDAPIAEEDSEEEYLDICFSECTLLLS